MMTHIPACSASPVTSTTPVLNTLCRLNGIGDKLLSVKSTPVRLLSQTLNRVVSFSANKMVVSLPALAATLNAWSGKERLSQQQVELWQEYLTNPNQPINAALKNYLEPCFALLARYLLEQPVMRLLGGKEAPVAEFLHPDLANEILDMPHNRQRLEQLFIDASIGEPTLESEIQHSLLLMIGCAGGGREEVKPRQMDEEMFEALYLELFDGAGLKWQKNTTDPARAQNWNPAEMRVKVRAFLTAKYVGQYVSSEMLVQLSGLPARLQSELLSRVWPAGTEPGAPQTEISPRPPGIHLPFAGTLNTLTTPRGYQFTMGRNTTAVLEIPVCPANSNITRGAGGVSLGGIGSEGEENMKLFLSNGNMPPTQVYFRSRHPETAYNAKLRPSPWPLLSHQADDVNTEDTTTAKAGGVCALRTVEPPAAPAHFTLQQPVSALPAGLAGTLQRFDHWLSGLINPPGVAGQQLEPADSAASRRAREVMTNSKYRVNVDSVNPVQYDRLSAIPPVATTAAPAQDEVRTAAHACYLWRAILNHVPANETEAGIARNLDLINENAALRALGKDARFQDNTVRTPANRLETLVLSLENLITRPDEDSPFALNEKAFAYLLNDLRSTWPVGLAVFHGGEPRARLRLAGKIYLPLFERVLKAIPSSPPFAGFAALHSQIIAELTPDTIQTLSVKQFARRVAEKTAAFCHTLGQQFDALSTLDLARIRLLLDELNKEAFPVLEFASHPQVQDERCFMSEVALTAALAAHVVADNKRNTIPLPMLKQIGLSMLLNQQPNTLLAQLGQTTHVSAEVKKRFIQWWEEETQTFADVLGFIRARRTLDKILLHPQGVTPAQLADARSDVHDALSKFYRHTFLDMPQTMRQALKQNYPHPVQVTFIQIARRDSPARIKPCLGIILQLNGTAYMVTPLPKISDASRPTWFDVTQHMSGSGFRTQEQKQALMNMLFKKEDMPAHYQLTLSTSPLRFKSGNAEQWAEKLAEGVVNKIAQFAYPASVAPSTSTTPTASANSTLENIWHTGMSILASTAFGPCLEFIDDLFGLDLEPNEPHHEGLVKIGSGVMCLLSMTPEEEAWGVVEKLLETGTQQAFRMAKNHRMKYRLANQVRQQAQQEDTMFIKWQEKAMADFSDSFVRVRDIYAQRDFQPWLAPQMQPSWAPLSRATWQPEPTGQEMLNELAGYAYYGPDDDNNKKVYLAHRYGDSSVKFEVASSSLSPTGEVRYVIPAGAPGDRMVTVVKDEQGDLRVVADNLIRFLPATGDGECQLYVPDGISIENIYVSTFNDNRLVLKIKDSNGKFYFRMLSASGSFIPFEPGIFSNVPSRITRGIDSDPSSSDGPIFNGRFGLARILDAVRKKRILELRGLRKKLLEMKTAKQLDVEITWLANQVKKMPAHHAMLKYADTLPKSDLTFHGYLALSEVVDQIARGAVALISPELKAEHDNYKAFLQKMSDAGVGLKNIIDIFGLPASDHALTEDDIKNYQKLGKELVNFGNVFQSHKTSFTAATAAFTARQMAYIRDYGDQLFKADEISQAFNDALAQPDGMSMISYVASGATLGNKFPLMREKLEKIDNADRFDLDLIYEAKRKIPGFISTSLKELFHMGKDDVLNTVVFDKYLEEYRKTLSSDTEYRVKVFKESLGFNPKTLQYALVKMNTLAEMDIFSWSGLKGFARAGKKENKIAVGCDNFIKIQSLGTTVRHEDFHFIAYKLYKWVKEIIGESYLDWGDRQSPLVRSQQRELLDKLMSAPDVFRTFIKDQEEFTRAYFHACVFSTNDEVARLAREIRDSWAYPLTDSNQQKIDNIIDILTAQPKLKIEQAYLFPDFLNAMIQQLVDKVPKSIADSVKAEWDPSDWR